jgi:hypothetical protein
MALYYTRLYDTVLKGLLYWLLMSLHGWSSWPTHSSKLYQNTHHHQRHHHHHDYYFYYCFSQSHRCRPVLIPHLMIWQLKSTLYSAIFMVMYLTLLVASKSAPLSSSSLTILGNPFWLVPDRTLQPDIRGLMNSNCINVWSVDIYQSMSGTTPCSNVPSYRIITDQTT